MKFQAELTDTFGGEANYSWVRRRTFDAPSDISDLALVRRAKAELGLTGTRCRREIWGDTIVLRPYGSCTIAVIESVYE
jgi:hypothetical protein